MLLRHNFVNINSCILKIINLYLKITFYLFIDKTKYYIIYENI